MILTNKRHRVRGVVVVFLGLASTSNCTSQQNPATLQISSPSSGTVVNPGQTFTVTVTSPANVPFTSVGVVGEDPIGFSSIATSLPAQFSFTIPADVACRTYMLTADASTASGQTASSDTILIDVERPDVPVSLSTLMQGISFQVIGEKSPVIVMATFADSAILEVTNSTNLSYASSNSSAATVDSNGVVTAIAPGRASITATYSTAQPGTQPVRVTIPVTVPPQILASSAVSLSFGNQNVGTTSTAQQLTLTNNGNGPLRILSLGTVGDFSETDNCVSSSPLPVAGTCTANIVFTPTATGARTGSVAIANGANMLPANIPLSGTGICHYVSFSAFPSTVPRGSNTLLTGTLMSCATTAQTVSVQFTLTAPVQGNCSATNSLMFTTPPFTLQPNTSQTFSFSAQVPSGICSGPYTVVATTLVNGQAVDTSTATLTVTP